MNLWTRTISAFRAGYRAFMHQETAAGDLTARNWPEVFAVFWAYYMGTIYATRHGDDWRSYLYDRKMYKHTRLIYNPVPQIVDFYVDNIWQPSDLADYPNLVTPAAADTQPAILKALEQLDQWSNFRGGSQLIKKYGAATGTVLIEAVDDTVREKVLDKTVWPGHILDFEVNNTNDLISYTLEYPVYDRERKVTFKYKKVITRESFSYFRDDAPYEIDGQPAVEPNPYGFCPAVLIKHADGGESFGLPACKDYDKVDETNILASHLHDNIHKTVESPVMISTDGEIVPITGAAVRTRPDMTSTETIDLHDPRLNWMVLKTKAGAGVLDLASKLKLAEAEPYLKNLLASFHDDYPELQAATIIRENSQLSGAALERMLGPAQNRLDGVQPNYNQQLVKLRQMQIAIAGWRTSNGWTQRTSQQAVFAPFDLDSYAAGQLDFHLEPSVLVRTTELEEEELLIKKTERANALKGLVTKEEQLKVAGYSEKDISQVMAEDEPPPIVNPAGLPENRQLPETVN